MLHSIQARQSWEYKIYATMGTNYRAPAEVEAELNQLGAVGWELVIGAGSTYVFRRPTWPLQTPEPRDPT